MASTTTEIEKKISSDTLNKKFIKIPMIFSVEGYGKTSHIVLTNHGISLFEFSEEWLKLILSCKSYVTEESDEDMSEFYGKAILLSAKSKPWVHLLPAEVAKSLRSAIDKCFESFHPSMRRQLHELKIWAAFQFARQGYMNMLTLSATNTTNSESIDGNDSKPEEPENQKNNEDSTANSLSMDHELILSVFPNDTHGLQTLCSKIPAFKKEANSAQNLIDLYNKFVREQEINKQCQENEEIQNHEKSLAELEDNYRNAAHLYTSQYASEENDDELMKTQNLKWLTNFCRHHNTLPKPLFGFGARHGVGEWGFLSLLPRLGFILKRLTPNNTFEPYTYPFQSTVASAFNASERLTKLWTRQLDYGDYSARVLHQYKLSSNKKSITVEPAVKSSKAKKK